MTSISKDEIKNIYNTSLFDLISKAHSVHSEHHPLGEVELCHLVSLKTGGCEENCKYCAQSSSWNTEVIPTNFLSLDAVLQKAAIAKKQGAVRICLGAGWRQVRDGKKFHEILEIVRELSNIGLEVCCTLGMLEQHHATQLQQAGLLAYNHNLDTSERFYPSIVTSRTYQDRLTTLERVKSAGLYVCSGAILGMGEEHEDRIDLIHTWAKLAPSSIPINILTPIRGTPFEHLEKISFWDVLRVIAVTRIVLPTTIIRLSAGRQELSHAEQTLCFLAGSTSIFSGEKLLTVQNADIESDEALFSALGLRKRAR